MPLSLSFRAINPNYTLRNERFNHEKYNTIPDAPQPFHQQPICLPHATQLLV
jgi:hypothetical protein